LATSRRIDFIRQLAERTTGLGLQRLKDLVDQMFGCSLDQLTMPQASQLIDTLKNVRSGLVDLEVLFDGSAPQAATPADQWP